MDKINELRAAYKDAMAKRQAAEKAELDASKALNAAIVAEFKFKPGDIVRTTRGEEVKVARVYVMFDDINLTYFQRRKDGSWGVREHAASNFGGFSTYTLIERPESVP